MHVELPAHAARVAQLAGDRVDRSDDRLLRRGFGLRASGGEQRLERAHAPQPSAEILGGELGAGDGTDVVVDVVREDRVRAFVADVLEEMLPVPLLMFLIRINNGTQQA